MRHNSAATDAMVSSIMVVGSLTHCALPHSMCDLIGIQMIVQHCLTQELMLYKFELAITPQKTSKNICCAKGEDAVDHSTVTRWVKKFCSDCKNIDN